MVRGVSVLFFGLRVEFELIFDHGICKRYETLTAENIHSCSGLTYYTQRYIKQTKVVEKNTYHQRRKPTALERNSLVLFHAARGVVGRRA